MKTFGQILGEVRRQKGVSQRELARRVKLAPSYLNEIENGQKAVPSAKIIQRLAKSLSVRVEDLYDAAACENLELPPDTGDLVRSHPETLALLRDLVKTRLSREKILSLRQQVQRGSVKAIILAAGKGVPVKGARRSLPQCLAIQWKGRTLLQTQLETLRQCGIRDVLIVRGFEGDKIRYPGVRYAWNKDYEHNSVLESLMSVENELDREVLVTYSDIFYEEGVLNRVLAAAKDIVIGVDIDWKQAGGGQPENVIFDSDNRVLRIGKIPVSGDENFGQFIGIMKLTRRGSAILREHYRRARLLFEGKPYQRAGVFHQAYLTDILQDMADLGVPVHCEMIGARHWKEISDIDEFRRAKEALAPGSSLRARRF